MQIQPTLLAREKCALCGGLGRRWQQRRNDHLCRCVYRAVFSLCLDRFMEFNADVACLGGNWDYAIAAEFRADFMLAARRILDTVELQVLAEYWILDRTYSEAGGGRLNKGQLFHAAYRVAEKVGRSLIGNVFPLGGYLSSARISRAAAVYTPQAWGHTPVFEMTACHRDPYEGKLRAARQKIAA